jgi:HD-GYP domain-containing protein (c-di-GMP phosphodiesterase class II)
MTSNRLYRDPLSHEDAYLEVERCQGTQFDPEVVQAFLAAVGAARPVGV